jgi:hypothetical protein
MKNMQWVCLKVLISCAASTLQDNKVGFGDTDNGTAPVLTLNIQLILFSSASKWKTHVAS